MPLDFVTGLPQVEQYIAIYMIIDWLTKQGHYIYMQTQLMPVELPICITLTFTVFMAYLTLSHLIVAHNFLTSFSLD